MIGKVYTAILPYYDRVSKKQKFKSRPCLVIGQADSGDYIILPISTISDKSKVDAVYDIPLDKSVYTFLNNNSYLRTHKQTVVNIRSLRGPLSDFKEAHENTYIEILSKVEEFQKQLINNAL